MIERSRHASLRPLPWNASEAAAAVEKIASDALAHFDGEQFWPAHPLDDLIRDGNASVYLGATGVIWALEWLGRAGAIEKNFDFRPALPKLLKTVSAEMAAYKAVPFLKELSEAGSLLLGDLGAALLVMRMAPTPAVADSIFARAECNNRMPVRELMWGTPGSMLACIHMSEMTAEPRWRKLFAAQAARLLAEMVETAAGAVWTQDLYGHRMQYLGAVHGYAGNMIPLLRGWHWLSESQRERIAEAVPRTLAANARRSDSGTNWSDVALSSEVLSLCQHCHGAPGMVTTFADAPFTAPELETLLLDGGRFIWAAGPLAKGSNLCHGTAGNGYAFLKLYRRTEDAIWLERARAFAMTAIAQCREAREQYGRGRYSLWTGDIGLAVYLLDCLKAEPRFPTVDVF